MNIILVPGLSAPLEYLTPLGERLAAEGHLIYGCGFKWNTLLNGEYGNLLRELDRSWPTTDNIVLIGHSAGGLLSVLSAEAEHPAIRAVIGLGTPLAGAHDLSVPYFEARSLFGWLLPLTGPDELRVFPVTHSALPLVPCVQDWIVEKLREIDA